MHSRLLRLPLAVALATLLLCAQALATWSIVIVNTRTGEVCVASATCLPNFNLRKATPVVIPGVGVAAAQSYLDSIGNRLVIHNEMLDGLSPDQILEIIKDRDSAVRLRQYGMVDLEGRALTFTGTGAGAWAGGVTGQVGDLVYAIQGNVLAGQPVVDDCEAAILSTPGDLADKVMVAMEAAHLAGGDGRCSCTTGAPDSCGAPPPNFTHSAYCAYFLLARPGDPKKDCDMNLGCGRGAFYLTINIKNLDANDPEPIGLMRAEYDQWRLDKAGKPDAVHSLVIPQKLQVSALAPEVVRYHVELYDIEGVALTQGGATIALEHQDGSLGDAQLVNVIDHQDGSYSVDVQSGDRPGRESFAFRVDDGSGYLALLWPAQSLQVLPPPVAPLAEPAAPLFPGLPDIDLRNGYAVSAAKVYSIARPAPGAPYELIASSLNAQTQQYDSEIVPLDGIPGFALRDLWVADDELELIFSAVDPADNIRRLYSAERDAITDPFETPELCLELNSDTGEQSPYVSRNGLELYFVSEQNGGHELYRSTRRAPRAHWLPAEQVPGVADGVAQATLFEGDQRLVVWNDVLIEKQLFERDAAGNWSPLGLMPGAVPTNTWLSASTRGAEANYPTVAEMLVVTDGAQGRAWSMAELGRQVLTARINEVSAAAGGVISYDLQSSGFQAASYEVLVGDPGFGTRVASLSLVLPLRANRFTPIVRSLAGQGNYADLVGTLSQGVASIDLSFAPGQLGLPGLVGRTLSLSAVLQEGGRVGISNAQALHILP
ncbi:MAG: hypothetical protein CMJ94_09315 [Planctomycetes bacterium]|nr:hypothetical protein [Planctomycetota bacterium]